MNMLKSVFLAGAATALLAGVAQAQSPADFYKGKNVELIIGYPTGGSNDTYSRLVAQHIGRHIPGTPNVIARNMPGAGSFLAVNTIYNTSAKDGTVLGLGSPTMALDEKLGNKGVRFKTSELIWIGRLGPLVNMVFTWKTSPVKTIEDAMKIESTLSGTGAGSTVSVYPLTLNNVLGTKFKLVMGYKGSNEAMLALERGEVEGHSTSWEVVKAVNPAWIKDGKLRFLVQHSITRHPELPNVPTSVELAKNETDRAILHTIMSAAEVGKAYFTTPGVPAERVTALRRAFDSMMKDPQFIDAVTKLGGDVTPMRGEELQQMIADLDKLPNDLVERVKAVYNEQ